MADETEIGGSLVLASDNDLIVGADAITGLGIETDEFAYFGQNTSEFTPLARTFQVPVLKYWQGETPMPVAFSAHTKAPILGNKREKDERGRWMWSVVNDGVTIPASVVCHDAHLHRLTLFRQHSRLDGHSYLLITGVLRVNLDVYVTIDGKEYPLVNLLASLVNNTLPEEKKMSVKDFARNVEQGLGIRFGGTMPLLWQHFGANPETIGFEGMKEVDGEQVPIFTPEGVMGRFAALGAQDVTTENNEDGRIIQQLAFPRSHPGIPVAQFELGQQNRAYSETQQGFLDLVNAQIENFVRIIKHRRIARQIGAEVAEKRRAQAEENAKGGKKVIITDEDAKKQLALAQVHVNMARRYSANWAGVQQRTKVKEGSPDDAPELYTENFFDPVNAPCGSMTLVLDDDERLEWDFWTRGDDTEGRIDAIEPDTDVLPEGQVDADLEALDKELGEVEEF